MEKEGNNDISTKTLAILFIITILVSFAGTFVVIRSLNDISVDQEGEPASSGSVALSLNLQEKPPEGRIELVIGSPEDYAKQQ
ncbi:MAG: hypothetical protein KKE20_01720 [Nanoarchaeota archaeon]|nr:hypothetical protein [Nanoarchaeota archaeon]